VAIEWSTRPPELLLHLDRSRHGTLGAQLQDELRTAVRAGRLQAGERLPSTRALAQELGVSRGLVQECYEQLVAEGYLAARTGAGTRVAERAARSAAPAARPRSSRAVRVDFRAGVPDSASFPTRDWLWALSDAARTMPLDAFAYGDPSGRPELRAVLAAYLRRVRGADVDGESIVVCSGFTQGLQLVLAALKATGHVDVGIEDPGHPDWASIARGAGMRPIAVPVDADGADLARVSGKLRAAILTPAHQTPSGVALAPQRRLEAIAWAAERDGYLIEDDYDAEFRYDRQPLGLLQGLAPDRVVSIGSVSKPLGPALRLGWIVCPAELHQAIAHLKRLADYGSPALDQLALARLIESGRYDRHLRRMRIRYRRKREALLAAVAEHAPEVAVTGLAAGFHAVLRLPTGADATAVARAAMERGIRIDPMSRYRLISRDHPPEVVLGFGNLAEPAIRRGIEAIADLISAGARPVPTTA
jgi:GntR family transcriptional regulator / MocR family aminotransferase